MKIEKKMCTYNLLLMSLKRIIIIFLVSFPIWSENFGRGSTGRGKTPGALRNRKRLRLAVLGLTLYENVRH